MFWWRSWLQQTKLFKNNFKKRLKCSVVLFVIFCQIIWLQVASYYMLSSFSIKVTLLKMKTFIDYIDLYILKEIRKSVSNFKHLNEFTHFIYFKIWCHIWGTFKLHKFNYTCTKENGKSLIGWWDRWPESGVPMLSLSSCMPVLSVYYFTTQ